MSNLDTDVVIIGAGSTGLLLAQGLKAAGIPFRIFERHVSDYVSREWSMSLHWGGEFLTKVLPPQIRERLSEIDVDPTYDFQSEKGFIQCNGETGEVLLVMPGTMPRRVSRRKLRTLMSEDITIEYGKTLESFTANSSESPPTVTTYFTDSSKVTSRILIGADGSRSRTRTLMIEDSSLSSNIETPYTIFNFPYTYPPETAAKIRGIHPIFKVSYHPKLNVMYVNSLLSEPDPQTGNVTFQNLLSWKGAPYPSDLQDQASRAARLKEIGQHFAEPFREAALGVDDGSEGLFLDRGMQWDPRKMYKTEEKADGTKRGLWNNHDFAGCVTLAGDAAHPMLPRRAFTDYWQTDRGQGLNNALEDASRLLTALTSALKPDTASSKQPPSLQSAIAEYESEMVARGGMDVEVSAKAAAAAHNWEMLMQSPTFRLGANKVQTQNDPPSKTT